MLKRSTSIGPTLAVAWYAYIPLILGLLGRYTSLAWFARLLLAIFGSNWCRFQHSSCWYRRHEPVELHPLPECFGCHSGDLVTTLTRRMILNNTLLLLPRPVTKLGTKCDVDSILTSQNCCQGCCCKFISLIYLLTAPSVNLHTLAHNKYTTNSKWITHHRKFKTDG